jgi:cytidylate kinase
VETIFSRAAETPGSVVPDASGGDQRAPNPSVAPPAEALRGFIQHAILQIARRGQVVIVAHGASLALQGEPDTLRVHVVASRETRVRRLALGTTLVSEDEYAKMVTDSDLQREKYLAQFYDVHEELPTLYDLVINTDVLDLRQAAATVVAAATAEASPAT